MNYFTSCFKVYELQTLDIVLKLYPSYNVWRLKQAQKQTKEFFSLKIEKTRLQRRYGSKNGVNHNTETSFRF